MKSSMFTDAQKAFARRFGTLNVHPYVKGMDGHPELLEIIKEPEDKLNFGVKYFGIFYALVIVSTLASQFGLSALIVNMM